MSNMYVHVIIFERILFMHGYWKKLKLIKATKHILHKIKVLVQPKMKIKSSITHPHAVPTP